MKTATIRNWGRFQHYKNRNPPWIKLHRGLLDDFDFSCLPLASKALAPLLWLLAAESDDGSVRIDSEWLAFRLRLTTKEVDAGLTPLINKGFLILASNVLADCLQDACLETEGETETETHSERQVARFEDFWKVYPNKKGRAAAFKKWKARKLDEIADTIIADVKRRIAKDRDWLRGYIPHGSTYVNGSGWEDDLPGVVQQAPTQGPSPRKQETAEDKIEAARGFARMMVDTGQWDKSKAQQYVTEAQQRHG